MHASALHGHSPLVTTDGPAILDRWALALQATLGKFAFPVIGPAAVAYLRLVRRHRIEGLREARAVYHDALSRGRPTLVCANHLTKVDSVFLHHVFGSVGQYCADFRRFSWNVPAVENFARDPRLRALTYLGKCVPVDRAGGPEHHRDVLERLAYLAASGDVCTIFPEGGRSRTGRVDPGAVTYGVGRILAALERPQVVCAYLRGERQAGYGEVPKAGDVMHVSACVIEPHTELAGLRGARDLARQVIVKLSEMEQAYFEGNRPSGRSASSAAPGDRT
jgi:hypothetical protein